MTKQNFLWDVQLSFLKLKRICFYVMEKMTLVSCTQQERTALSYGLGQLPSSTMVRSKSFRVTAAKMSGLAFIISRFGYCDNLLPAKTTSSVHFQLFAFSRSTTCQFLVGLAPLNSFSGSALSTVSIVLFTYLPARLFTYSTFLEVKVSILKNVTQEYSVI